MKLAMVGLGLAGGRIVDRFLAYDRRTGGRIVQTAIAVDTDDEDLRALARVPRTNRVSVRRQEREDGRPGLDLANVDRNRIAGAVENVSTSADAFLVVAGLSGVSGATGPTVIRQIRQLYGVPVYGLAVLPTVAEGDDPALAAARAYGPFREAVDALIVLDNEAWLRGDEPSPADYDLVNAELSRRVGLIFGAGEVDGGEAIAESVVDSSEIANTLGGDVASIGYAAEQIPSEESGFLSRVVGTDGQFSLDAGTQMRNRMTNLIRMAALGRLTLPCELGAAERALVVTAGPPAHLNREGIERGRSWIQAQTGTMEVRGGDYPLPDADHVACAILLGIGEAPRLETFRRIAGGADEGDEAGEAPADGTVADLLQGGEPERSPLY